MSEGYEPTTKYEVYAFKRTQRTEYALALMDQLLKTLETDVRVFFNLNSSPGNVVVLTDTDDPTTVGWIIGFVQATCLSDGIIGEIVNGRISEDELNNLR